MAEKFTNPLPGKKKGGEGGGGNSAITDFWKKKKVHGIAKTAVKSLKYHATKL